MAKLALYAHLQPKAGKEKEVEAFLKSALPLANNEKGTITWYAFAEDGGAFGIFDTFADEAIPTKMDPLSATMGDADICAGSST